MASSGYLSTSNQYVKYWIEVITNSQNVSSNTSNITVKVWAKRTNTGYTTSGSGSITLKIDGTYYNSGTKSISISSNTVLLHSWTGNTGHASDGTKTLQAYASVNISGILSSSEQLYSENLTTIPRTSSFTINKTSCELGTSYTVSISRASSSFTHSVSYSIGTERRYQQNWNGSATTVSYTPPISDSSYFTNSTSGNVIITVDTYNGGTLIGTATKSLTVTIPSSVVPSFSSIGVTKVDNGVPSAWGVYVKGKSKATLTINGASGIYNSTISKYAISGGGYSSTASSFTTDVLNTVGTNSITATITDTRGRIATKSTSITVVDYYTPSIVSCVIDRCLADGSLNEDGTYCRVIPTFTFASVSGKNSVTANIKYREIGATAWSSATTVTSGSGYTIGGAIDVDKSYEFLLSVTDAFTTVTKSEIVQTAFVTMDFLMGGKGVAFGKVAQTSDYFDVNFLGWFRKKTVMQDELEVRGGFKLNSEFSDGKPYYHHTNGYFIKTTLPSNLNIMGELYITGNSYGLTNPIDIKMNWYAYNGDLINLSCKIDGAYIESPSIFSTSDGFVGIWFPQPSNYMTFRFKLATNATTYTYYVTNSARPSDVTNIKYFPLIYGYNTRNASAIVERGSNANGDYIKLLDGSLICTRTYTYSSFACTTANGSVYYGSSNNWTFPHAFLSGTTPEITADAVSGSACRFVTITSRTNTYFNSMVASSVSHSGGFVYTFIAVGRWK